jgi:type IV fimbrial biogenesis protein FimT
MREGLPRSQGTTLMESLIGIAIIAVMLSLAVPSVNTLMQNAQVRAVSESILSGLQLARLEAVRRNGQVQFVLTNDAPAATVTANASGKNWVVRASLGGGDYAFIQGSANAADAPSVTIEAKQGATATSSVMFNSFGRTLLTAALTVDVTGSSGARALRILLSSQGQTRLCDPGLTDTSNPQAC